MSSSLNEIVVCEICSSNKTPRPRLDLRLYPMCDDLVPVGDKWCCKEYRMEVIFCVVWSLAQRQVQIPRHERFRQVITVGLCTRPQRNLLHVADEINARHCERGYVGELFDIILADDVR